MVARHRHGNTNLLEVLLFRVVLLRCSILEVLLSFFEMNILIHRSPFFLTFSQLDAWHFEFLLADLIALTLTQAQGEWTNDSDGLRALHAFVLRLLVLSFEVSVEPNIESVEPVGSIQTVTFDVFMDRAGPAA